VAIQKSQDTADDYVSHLSVDEVRRLTSVVDERDRLLITLLFDGCLRCSEAISVRPVDFVKDNSGWLVKIKGKGSKPGSVAVSPSLVAQIQAYAYREQLPQDARIFDVTRGRVFQIVSEAFKKAGIRQPSKVKDRVGCVHVLRHSGAIERLKQTGNPKAVQDQLRHRSAKMTLRYMKTISKDESLSIQQGVDYKW
jgi:integrase